MIMSRNACLAPPLVSDTLHIAGTRSVSAGLVLTGRLATASTDWPSPRCTVLRETRHVLVDNVHPCTPRAVPERTRTP